MVQLKNKQLVGPQIFDLKIENYIPIRTSQQTDASLARELHFDDLSMCKRELERIKHVKDPAEICKYHSALLNLLQSHYAAVNNVVLEEE